MNRFSVKSLVPAVALFAVMLSGAGMAQQQSAPAPQMPRSIPEWARGVVWYRILIDRFRNGDSTNDMREDEVIADRSRPWEISEWTSNWYQLTIKELLNNPDFYTDAFQRQYGGDFKGIRDRLDYLKHLGVGAIALSPVWESNSSHKYDVNSLHHADPHFGPLLPIDSAYLKREIPDNPMTWYWTSADRAFIDLIRDIHARGMKVIVDVQFAHVSVNFWAFRDVLQKQEKSAFGSWFTINEWDHPETPFHSEFSYKSMWNIDAFPELRKDSLGLVAGPREYVFSCTRRWMDPDGDGNPSDGIDGWHIDLAGELSPAFWQEWTAFVTSINPQALIIGGPMDPKHAGRRIFDLTDGDLFAGSCSRFVLNGSITPTQFESALQSDRGNSEESAADAHVNWVDNHETDRLASMCVNRAVRFETGNSYQSNKAYAIRKPASEERALQKMIVVLQMTEPGAPMIYYGDEAGMWGGDDPDCRKPMLWPELHYEDECSVSLNGDKTRYPVAFDSAMYGFYRQLIALRERHLSLRAGSISTILLDDVKMLYGYSRQSGTDRVFILMNAGKDAQECRVYLNDVREGTRIDAPLQNLHFYADSEGLLLVIPPETVAVLIPRL